METAADSPTHPLRSSAFKRRSSPSLLESDNVKRTRLFDDKGQQEATESNHEESKENIAHPKPVRRSHSLISHATTVESRAETLDENIPSTTTSATTAPASITGVQNARSPPTKQANRPNQRAGGRTDDRSRGKRLFGSLLGTLAKANTSSDLAIQRRRADIERKQQLRARQQTHEDDDKRYERLQRLNKIRRREHWDFEERAMKNHHAQITITARFLQTKTEPKLYFRPKVLLPVEEDIIDDQLDYAEDQIESELDDFEQRRTQARSRSFAQVRDRGRDGHPGHGDFGAGAGQRRNRQPHGRAGDSWVRGRDIDYTTGGRDSSSRSPSPTRGHRQNQDQDRIQRPRQGVDDDLLRVDGSADPRRDHFLSGGPPDGEDSMDIDTVDDPTSATAQASERLDVENNTVPVTVEALVDNGVTHNSQSQTHGQTDQPQEQNEASSNHNQIATTSTNSNTGTMKDTVIEGEEDTVIY